MGTKLLLLPFEPFNISEIMAVGEVKKTVPKELATTVLRHWHKPANSTQSMDYDLFEIKSVATPFRLKLFEIS